MSSRRGTSAAAVEGGADGTTVQTLDRGLRVLHLLSRAPDGLTVGDVAALLDVHRAVVYRLLGTLARHRLVARGPDGRYRLSVGLVELARGVVPRWRAIAWPELEALADELTTTAVLSVAAGESCVALLVAEPRTAPLHIAYQPGLRHPLTVGASGKAILSGRPAAAGEPRAVAEARRRGFATSRGEIQPGAIGVAAPIVVDGWADASVGAVAFGEFDASARRLVMRAAGRIAAAFPGGATGPVA